MEFRRDICGVTAYLKIKGYTKSTKDEWDCQWCNCDFAFMSGDWLNYHKEDDEVLLSCEVEELAEKLTKLLEDELTENTEIICIEPDFIFKLYPKRDFRKDPNVTHVQKGYEIADIYMEWEIFFWNEGLTDNRLTLTFGREEIEALRNYLLEVIHGVGGRSGVESGFYKWSGQRPAYLDGEREEMVMKEKRKRGKKILITVLSVIAALIVIAGGWYGFKIHSEHKLLMRVEEMSFEELMQEALAGKEDARVTVGIIKDGQMSYEVYGADAEVLEQTEYLYEIGSVTKTMTAALIAQAVQEEKLQLTDTIDKYLDLPEGKVYPTIESLLTHTSGLDEEYYEWSMLPYLIHPEQNPFQGITDEIILEEFQSTKLVEGKEYKFKYSNYGFALLGLVIEEVYGTDYTSLLNEYLQDNLNMEDTHVSDGDADFEGNWVWETDDAYISAGAVVSDISDMLIYADAQLGGDSTLDMCHQALKEIDAADKWARMRGLGMDKIGMGWMIDTENGIIWHNGGTGMHTSYLGFCPEKNAAVVVLSNLSLEEDIQTTTIGYKKLMEIIRF